MAACRIGGQNYLPLHRGGHLRRRFVTAALLALFLLQSSGAALATPLATSGSASLLAQTQFAFIAGAGALASTHIGAFVLGRESQYEAMHAPAPDFSKARAAAARPLIRPDLHLPRATPMFHPGMQLHPRVSDWHAFNPHMPPADPLAMTQKVGSARCAMPAVNVGHPLRDRL